ncbi:MAG: CDP-archaeol synthase [Clostridia bacterium]|nr:CDP-archaeol synthase [Clostridia bacterium]
MYVTLFPTIIAGVLNMVWCKSSILKKLNTPVDFKKNFIDGKRIFGENKTFKGILGYVIFNIISAVLWGFLCRILNIENYNFFFINYTNTFFYNVLIGTLLGLAYSLFELPNSFIKRRIGIAPGKTTSGLKKIFFIFLDQADSIFGCCLVVCVFFNLSLKFYFLYVIVGAITHIVINILLYLFKLRKNMF